MKKIILASASSRRKELLEQIGLQVEIKVSDFNEKAVNITNPRLLVRKLSLGKARSAAKYFKNAIIIAADTIIICNKENIGKPADQKDAQRILKKLSGQSHTVITGFTIIDTKKGKTVGKQVKTKVHFKKLSNKEIDIYIQSGEPMDKAGAYGIQKKGSLFIKKIEGDYFNIVGLPIFAVAEELRKFGIEL